MDPRLLSEAAKLHDNLTHYTFCSIMGLNIAQDDKWSQCCLPIKHGGFGLWQLQDISPGSFLAAWAHTIEKLPIRFPDMDTYISSVVTDSSCIPSTSYRLRDAYQQVLSLLPQSNSHSNMSFQELLSTPQKLQHRLSTAIGEGKAKSLLDRAETDQCSARLRSVMAKESGSWIQAIPTSHELALQPREYRLAACLRLGLPLPVEKLTTCNCGSPIDCHGYHLLTCKRNGGPVKSHDAMVSCWSHCLKDVNILHTVEPRNRYVDSSGRPDITVFDSGTLSAVELDVSLAHPLSKEVINTSSKIDGQAALTREVHKKMKYEQFCLPGGFSPTLVPLVFEHYGRWGDEAKEFLKNLANHSKDEHGQRNKVEFLTYWRRRLAITLQKSNTRTIFNKLDCVVPSFYSTDTQSLVQLHIH